MLFFSRVRTVFSFKSIFVYMSFYLFIFVLNLPLMRNFGFNADAPLQVWVTSSSFYVLFGIFQQSKSFIISFKEDTYREISCAVKPPQDAGGGGD